MNILSSILPFIPVVILAVVLIAILATGYVKSSPDVAYIISGPHKKPRILIGKSGIKIPFFEKLDKLSLGAIQIDVKTRTAVPTAEYINVKVDSTVSVQVGRTDEMIALAAQNFLNVKREVIAERINDLLEGNIREIVGQMKLTEMVSDRKAFSEKVQQNVVPDLARFGLELVSFNVQNFSDEGGVIDNLGIDNVEQIRKNAAIAKSDAQREIAIAEAANIELYGGTMLEGAIGTIASAHAFSTFHALEWGTELFGPLLITEEILETPLRYENFELQIPQGPGLGITLDEDRIQFFNRAQRKKSVSLATSA